MNRRIGLYVYVCDCDSGHPILCNHPWESIDCGMWAIGSVKHHVVICHPPERPPDNIELTLDLAFAEKRRHGLKCVKLPNDQWEDAPRG